MSCKDNVYGSDASLQAEVIHSIVKNTFRITCRDSLAKKMCPLN